jgi:hypothetical protein
MTITVGSKVYLRACRAGAPGVVIRIQPRRITIHWVDLDYIGHHSPESLELAEQQPTDSQEAA